MALACGLDLTAVVREQGDLWAFGEGADGGSDD